MKKRFFKKQNMSQIALTSSALIPVCPDANLGIFTGHEYWITRGRPRCGN